MLTIPPGMATADQLAHAIAAQYVNVGWNVTRVDATGVSAQRQGEKASGLVVCLLLLLCIIPAIVYLVNINKSGGAPSLVQITTNIDGSITAGSFDPFGGHILHQVAVSWGLTTG